MIKDYNCAFIKQFKVFYLGIYLIYCWLQAFTVPYLVPFRHGVESVYVQYDRMLKWVCKGTIWTLICIFAISRNSCFDRKIFLDCHLKCKSSWHYICFSRFFLWKLHILYYILHSMLNNMNIFVMPYQLIWARIKKFTYLTEKLLRLSMNVLNVS